MTSVTTHSMAYLMLLNGTTLSDRRAGILITLAENLVRKEYDQCLDPDVFLDENPDLDKHAHMARKLALKGAKVEELDQLSEFTDDVLKRIHNEYGAYTDEKLNGLDISLYALSSDSEAKERSLRSIHRQFLETSDKVCQ